MKTKEFWITVFSAWMVFIGIDFLFHASLFETLWQGEIAAFKSQLDLFLLIPAGYGSFLLLTILAGWVFGLAFSKQPDRKRYLKTSLIFSSLFAASHFLALYSFIKAPLKHLLLFSAVYFIELFAVMTVFYRAVNTQRIHRVIVGSLSLFVALLIVGIVIQNLG
ncbi:MAG: hypothetical protein R6V00_02705 [Candidatus Aminicenantes bacterium]